MTNSQSARRIVISEEIVFFSTCDGRAVRVKLSVVSSNVYWIIVVILGSSSYTRTKRVDQIKQELRLKIGQRRTTKVQSIKRGRFELNRRNVEQSIVLVLCGSHFVTTVLASVVQVSVQFSKEVRIEQT